MNLWHTVLFQPQRERYQWLWAFSWWVQMCGLRCFLNACEKRQSNLCGNPTNTFSLCPLICLHTNYPTFQVGYTTLWLSYTFHYKSINKGTELAVLPPIPYIPEIMAGHSYFSHKTTPKTQLTVKATAIISRSFIRFEDTQHPKNGWLTANPYQWVEQESNFIRL